MTPKHVGVILTAALSLAVQYYVNARRQLAFNHRKGSFLIIFTTTNTYTVGFPALRLWRRVTKLLGMKGSF